MSAGFEEFMWRSDAKWADVTAAANSVIARWNSVTSFVVNVDQRERIWTVRHASTMAPFLVIAQDSMRGSLPRIGNPMPFLLMLGIGIARPGLVSISFANGQKIDPTLFELKDLVSILPHATHPAHRKLAELALQGAPEAAKNAPPA